MARMATYGISKLVRIVDLFSIMKGFQFQLQQGPREKGQVNSDTKKIRTYRSLILLEIRQARIILRVTVSAVSDL